MELKKYKLSEVATFEISNIDKKSKKLFKFIFEEF